MIYPKDPRPDVFREPFTRANPLGNGATYKMLSTDTIVYAAAGAQVTMPDRPIQGREYLVKVVSGTAETTAVQVFAPKGRTIEDPSAGSPYTFRSGATPATITTSGACNGWRFDGAAMNLSR